MQKISCYDVRGNGYETHCSIFLFTFFNCDSAQNKNIPAYTLDNEPMKTFGSGQSSIMSEHKTNDCAGWRPRSSFHIKKKQCAVHIRLFKSDIKLCTHVIQSLLLVLQLCLFAI